MTTLSLNVIVGPAEQVELERLMKSVQGPLGPLFDEIVVTTTSPDEQVKSVAKKYATRVPEFQWCDDFSAARNFSFSQSTSSYILWLDADDILSAESYKSLLENKEKIVDYEVILLPYNYAHDEKGTPIVVLPRERIIVNNGKYQWHDAIHEYIDFTGASRLTKWEIPVTHARSKPFNPDRNLKILEKMYSQPGCKPRTAFYYGKELFDSGKGGIEILEKYVEGPADYQDNKASACIRLAKWYMDRQDINNAEKWAAIGTGHHNGYAELYVVLGAIWEARGSLEKAVEFFLRAANTPFGQAGMAQMRDFYTFLPCAKLASCYHNLHQWDKADQYADKALSYKPGTQAIIELKGYIAKGRESTKDDNVSRIEHLERCINHLMLQTKPQHVVIWTGPAWESWTPETVMAGMAGSETWACMLARSLSERGYRVTVYNDLPDKTMALTDSGVIYRDHTHLIEDLREDVVHHFISSRSTAPIGPAVHACRTYVMIHDIWLSPDKSYDIKEKQVHRYAYLSDWHKKFLMEHHNIPEYKLFKTINGVDQKYYLCDPPPKKNMTVYSSSPDRGLEQLLDMWPRIRAEVPDAQLEVLYGFNNWEAMCKQRNQPTDAINRIKAKMKQPGVTYRGRQPKALLARMQMVSKIWLYPTAFTETFSITAVENGLARNAILSTKLAGLETTVGPNGILIEGNNLSEDYQRQFIGSAVQLFLHEDVRSIWAKKAYDNALQYTWARAADEWIGQFNGC